MADFLEEMLNKYNCRNAEEYRYAIKEIVQEVALGGMSRSGFFQGGAFYGGTALRIFHGLRRFSEDMDFSLLEANEKFRLEKFLPTVKEELWDLGLEMTVERKEKTKMSPIQSAFIKGDTLVQIVNIVGKADIKGMAKGEVIKIKLEVDTKPPAGATYETKYTLKPIPAAVKLYDKPSLFAGKIHALLCRNWQNRVKGRDFYDYIWYVSNDIPLNVEHLKKRLEQSGKWDGAHIMLLSDVKQMLVERFDSVDYDNAKKDVIGFIRNPAELDVWSKDFFVALTHSLTARL